MSSLSAFQVEQITVAKEEGDNLLGHLVWYTISECLIDRTTLRGYLSKVGLNEGFMPPEIRLPDAFRRATKSAEENRVPSANSKVFYNFLVREVTSNKEIVERALVIETVDSENKRLEYESNAVRFTLDKKVGTVAFRKNQAGISAKVDQVLVDYDIFKSHHDSRAIRSMIYNILSSLAPVSVRPSGGIYFIPIQHEETLRKLVDFISLLVGESEGWMIPVIDRNDMRDMVKEKLSDQLKTTISSLKKSITIENASVGKINNSIDEAKQIIQNFGSYQETLGSELEDMYELTNLIKLQVRKLADKLTATEKE